MESLDVVSRHRIQTLKEATAKGPPPVKGWVVQRRRSTTSDRKITRKNGWDLKQILRVLNLLRPEEVLDSLQLLLSATYPAIVRVGSVPDLRQRANIAILRDKYDN